MFQAGWALSEIIIQPQGLAMHGFGQAHHRAWRQRTPLHARAISFSDEHHHRLLICCLDLGYVTYALRQGIEAGLQSILGARWDTAALVITCTHTHSGPGGCAHEALYNLVTPGFVEAHVTAIIQSSLDALTRALADEQPVDLNWIEGCFDDQVDVAWNRSLKAYLRNPEVKPVRDHERHRALDRFMRVMTLTQNGQVRALISLFGVHATCLGNQQDAYDADNKGYAARATEKALSASGETVAIFAQGTAGDVSPYYHGPGERKRRQHIQGEAEVAYAVNNGQMQSRMALQLAQQEGERLQGALDSILAYVDMTQVSVDPRFSRGQRAWSTQPAHGVSFFAGTPIDGPGLAAPLAHTLRFLSRGVRWRQQHADTTTRSFYEAQGNKDVLLHAGKHQFLGQAFKNMKLPGWLDPVVAELKRQVQAGAIDHSPLVPTVLPLQIIALGQVGIVACPGEFTTVAGQRLLQGLAPVLAARGITRLVMMTYCNDYMGYVTTQEEYQEQAYEGGHTLYGQWTLAAFQTCFDRLAKEFIKPRQERKHDVHLRPEPVPPEELRRRSHRERS
ncbi:MAG: ceramidase [Pseudomonadales bacterium]|nr:ceramidase [Pseudomonadales bacterium]